MLGSTFYTPAIIPSPQHTNMVIQSPQNSLNTPLANYYENPYLKPPTITYQKPFKYTWTYPIGPPRIRPPKKIR